VVFDIVIVVNAICLAVDVMEGEAVFLALYISEILLKIYTLGGMNFLRNAWNV